jgi:hypothetical protein
MTSMINTSHNKSLFGGTLTVDGITLAVGGGAQMVGGDTSTVGDYTLTVGGGTSAISSRWLHLDSQRWLPDSR